MNKTFGKQAAQILCVGFCVVWMGTIASADDKHRGNKHRGRSFTGISISPAGVGFEFASNGFGIAIAPGTLRGIQSQGIIAPQQFVEPAPFVAPANYQPVPVIPPGYAYPQPNFPHPHPGYSDPRPPVGYQQMIPPRNYSNRDFGPSPTPATPAYIQQPMPTEVDRPVPSPTPATHYRPSHPELTAPQSVLTPSTNSNPRMHSVLEN